MQVKAPTKKKNDRSKTHKYVWLEEGCTGFKAGLHHARTDVVGNTAFIRRTLNNGKTTTTAIPASNVFETEHEAHKYIANKGQKKWCVIRKSARYELYINTDLMYVAECMVREVRDFQSYANDWAKVIYELKTGSTEASRVSSHNVSVYDTEEEALAAATGPLHAHIKELENLQKNLKVALASARRHYRKMPAEKRKAAELAYEKEYV